MKSEFAERRTSTLLRLLVTVIVSFQFIASTSWQAVAITFEPAQNLSSNPTFSDFSDVATQIAASGQNVYVVWQDEAKILFRRSTDSGANFDAFQEIAVSASAHRPMIAASGLNVFVVWNATGADSQNHLFLRRSTDGGQTFESTQDLGVAPSPGSFFRMVVDGSSIYVAWLGVPLEVRFRRSTDDGATWSPALNQAPDILSSGVVFQAGLALAVSGINVYVAWVGIDPNTSEQSVLFRSSIDGGSGFGSAQPVAANANSPHLAASGTNVYLSAVVFKGVITGAFSFNDTDIIFRRSTDGGATWDPPLGQDPVNMSQTTGTSDAPQVALGNGNLYLFWMDSPTDPNHDPFDLLFRRSTDGGATWSPAASLSALIPSFEPYQLAVSGLNIAVVWQNSFTPSEIFFRSSSDGGVTWDPLLNESALNLSANAGDSFRPRTALSGSNVYVAWVDDSPGNFDVFFRRGREPSPIDDNFNNNSLNTSVWESFVSPTGIGTVLVANQRLEVTLNPGAGNAGITGRCFVSGDFDVQVDFGLLSWPANNGQTVKLAAADLGSGTFGLLGIERFGGNPESYHLVALNSVEGFAAATDTGGKLRLNRSGSTLTGFYHSGAAFAPLANTSVTTDPTRFVLNVGSNNPSGAAVNVAFDNFIVNAGSVQCPVENPALSVTPSPLDFGTVPVGTFKDLPLTIQNTGGGTLTGTATLSGGPFSIIGANSFSLGANETKIITVRFSPPPEGIFSGNVNVVSNAGNSSVIMSGIGVSGPFISSIFPTTGSPSVLVTISGRNFGPKKGTVKFGSKTAQINSWNDTQIQTTVPSLSPGFYTIIAITKQETSNAASFQVIGFPFITAVSPNSGKASTQVSISGDNFGASIGSVQFGSELAPVISWNDTRIRVFVPQGLTGTAPVTVTTAAGASNAAEFTYTPSGGEPVKLVRTSDRSRNIGLKFVTKQQLENEVIVDIEVSNGRGTWLFIRRGGNLTAPDCIGAGSEGCIPFIFMLGPLQQKTFRNITFSKGIFLELRATKAGIFGDDQRVPFFTVAMDLAARGLFGIVMPPNSFDVAENLLPLAIGLATEVAEELSKLAGEFVARRIHFLPVALLKFAKSLDYNNPGIVTFLRDVFKNTALVNDWVDLISRSLTFLIQIIELPSHGFLVFDLARETIRAPQEGFLTLLAR